MGIIRALVIGATLGIGTLVFDAQPVFACDCHDGGPVCEAFWNTPVVFVGRVEEVTVVQREGQFGPTVRVRFRVIEALRGTTAREIELFTYSTSCDLTFAPQEDWIIYAFPRGDGPGLTTSACSDHVC
jgi:hypothetical protein